MAITEAEKEKLVEAFRQSYPSLVKYRHILLQNDEDLEVDPAPFHEQWSDILLGGTGNFAIEAFRESAKSQYCLRTFCLHQLTFPRAATDYIVIIKKNTKLARAKLREIETEYLANTVISGNLENVNEQSGEVFDIDCTNREGVMMNVRIEAYGKGASIRGLAYKDRRPKIVIVDDPQDIEDASSDTVSENDWTWFLSDVMFLGKYTRIFLIGNNLGEKSIIETVFTYNDELHFETMRIPCLTKEKKSAWPSAFTTEQAEAERESFRNLGKVGIWYREKMCQALGEDRKFVRSNLRYYDPRKIEDIKENCNVFIRTDLIPPPKEEKDRGDRCAIVVFGRDSDDNWFIFDVYNERVDPSVFLDEVFSRVVKFSPVLNVGFPDVAMETAIEHFCQVEQTRRKIYFETILQKQHTKKEDRIIGCLQPIVASHRLMLPQFSEWLAVFENQLLMFPKGKFIDIIDALASGDEDSFAPLKKTRRTNLPRRAKSNAPLI